MAFLIIEFLGILECSFVLLASWIQLIDWNLSIEGGIAFGLSCINSSPGGLLLPDLHQLPHFLRPGAMHMLWSALISKIRHGYCFLHHTCIIHL